jgi:hypothetical protein
MCEQCHASSGIDFHHVRYCKWGEFDPPDNILLLCRDCHETAHTCDSCGNVNLKAFEIKRNVSICVECRKGHGHGW